MSGVQNSAGSLLLWSGGCDSTMVLTQLLSESPRRRVRTLSVRHPQFLAASEQMRARDQIQERLRQKWGYEFERIEVTIDHAGAGLDGCCVQAVTWIALGQGYLLPNETLCVGYMQADSIWYASERLQQGFVGLQAASGKQGALCFPAQWSTRAEIFKSLDEWGLTDLCWWCEAPQATMDSGGLIVESKPCGRCNPCVEHAAARTVPLASAVSELASKLRREYADSESPMTISRLAMAEALEKMLGR